MRIKSIPQYVKLVLQYVAASRLSGGTIKSTIKPQSRQIYVHVNRPFITKRGLIRVNQDFIVDSITETNGKP